MSPSSYVLRIARGDASPRQVELSQEVVVIGRDAGDLPLHDPGCSTRHAELRFRDGAVLLHDLGSTNGTWRGSHRVTTEALAEGVVYTIGTTRLELVEIRHAEIAPSGTLILPAPKATTTITVRSPAGPTRSQTIGKASDAAARVHKRRLVVASALAAAVAVAAGLWSAPAGAAGRAGDPGLLTGPREQTVQAVWVRGPQGPGATGGTSAATVRITPNAKDGARVGVIEEFAGGAGDQWKTAAWLAAFRSSELSGRSLLDHEFTVAAGGHIDGPSAGMLVTATMLALLRGKPVREDTTMTGTINPDGSTGPVGGIVQKMDGAARKGIKRFGFPLGARNHRDMRDGSTVDLFEAAREFGLEAREIDDVFEAYEFLTGDALARPTPASETDMELDRETLQRLRSKNAKWQARLRGEITSLEAALRNLGLGTAQMRPLEQRLTAMFQQAVDFERSDFPASAYDCYVQAALLATEARERAGFLKNRGDTETLVAMCNAAGSVVPQVEALASEIALAARQQDCGGQMVAMRALQTLVTAESYAQFAEVAREEANALLQKRKDDKLSAEEGKQLQESLYAPRLRWSIAQTLLDVANDLRDFTPTDRLGAAIDAPRLGRKASAYGSASGAVVSYLESLAGDEIEPDRETDYRVAAHARDRAVGMSDAEGDANLLRLASGSLAFLKGASLVNKYYSLGGRVDEKGNLTLGNRKALSAQLDLARQLAREAATKAKDAVGAVPVTARFCYQLGVARREGDDRQKLLALEALWESAFWSELAAEAAAAKAPR